MANKSVQFASNTLKYESDSIVRGSKGLYVFQFGTGTNRDLRQELINYHAEKVGLTELIKDSNPSKNIGECFWGVFKKPDGQSYEDFIDDVKHSRAGFIGNTPIIPTGRDYTRVDSNGNLLVATINSKLDNYLDGSGNMLISGQTGEVIRAPKPSVIINPVDERTGFYPIEIYKTKENKATGVKEVYDREYNFIDADGKILCDDFDFKQQDEESIIKVPRNLYMRDGNRIINNWEVYPVAYVHCGWKGVELFTSVMDLITENRKRIANEELPIVKDDSVYVREYFIRKSEIEEVVETLGKSFDNGTITQAIYDKAIEILNREFDAMDEFESSVLTVEDEKAREDILKEIAEDEDFIQ